MIIIVAAFTGMLAVYVNRRDLTNITDIVAVTAVAGLVGGIIFDIIYILYIVVFSSAAELGGVGVADVIMVGIYLVPAIIMGTIYGALTVKLSKTVSIKS